MSQHDHGPGHGAADPGERDPVGSASEEAMRLLGAVGDWAKEHAGSAAGAASEFSRSVEDHLDPGPAGETGTTCQYCPICRTAHLVRQASPEVRSHLVSAATSLLQAASAVLDAAGHPGEAHSSPPERGATGQSGPELEKIDLDAGWDAREETTDSGEEVR